MAMVINSNIASLTAQRHLSQSRVDMETAMERMSSGKRINSSMDDAAGLAIGNRMTSQIEGLNQAIRNANDGISLAQTAEGTLDAHSSILQRMRVLAIQAANDTYSSLDKQTLNNEVSQLKEEINRNVSQASFNGQQILDGTNTSFTFQIGHTADDSVTINLKDMSGSEIGTPTWEAKTGVTTPLTTSRQSIAGDAAGSSDVTGDSGSTAAAISVVLTAGISSGDVAAITVGGITVSHTFTATAANASDAADAYVLAWNADSTALAAFTVANSSGTLVFTATSAVDGAVVASAEYAGNTIGGSGGTPGDGPTLAATSVVLSAGSSKDDIATITVGGITVSHTFAADTATATLAGDAYAAAWNADTSARAAFTAANSAGTLVFTATDPSSTSAPVAAATYTQAPLTPEQQSQENYDFSAITLVEGDRVSITITGGETYTQAFVTDKATTLNALGALVVNGEDGYVSKAITEGKLVFTGAADGTALAPATTAVESSSVDAANSIDDLLVTDTVSATKALKVIDDALEMMADFRSRMGAVSNRMFMTVDNLMNVSENTSSARSRIVDADFALESANLAKSQILQKAGTAMLSQANASTQDILSLLK